MWCSGDEDGLSKSEVWSLKNWGVRPRDRVRGVNRVRDRDKVRAGREYSIFLEKHPSPPSKKSGQII